MKSKKKYFLILFIIYTVFASVFAYADTVKNVKDVAPHSEKKILKIDFQSSNSLDTQSKERFQSSTPLPDSFKSQKGDGVLIYFILPGVLLLGGIIIYILIDRKSKSVIRESLKDYLRSIDDIYEMDKLSDYTLNYVMKKGNSHKGTLIIFNKNNNTLKSSAFSGFNESDSKPFSLFAGDNFNRWLQNCNRAIISTSSGLERQKARFAKTFPSLLDRINELKVTTLIPLYDRGLFAGFIAVDNFQIEDYSPRAHKRWLQALNQSSVPAILTLMLYEANILDDLTGLYNKRYFWHTLYLEIERAKEYNQSVSLMIIDIDDYGKINEKFGLKQGDEILKETAKILKNILREGIDMGARIGGGKLGAILPTADIEKGVTAAGRLIKIIREHTFPQIPKDVTITASAGIATYPVHANSPSDLFARSEESLKEAKKQGKNRVHNLSNITPAESNGSNDEALLAKIDDTSRTLIDETGLYSREYFNERYLGEVHRSDRTLRPCALLLIKPDIQISEIERLGIFTKISNIFRRNLRKGIDVYAHFEKDTLAILLPDTDLTPAGMIARRLKMLLDKTTIISDERRVTFSIGLSIYPTKVANSDFVESAKYALKACYEMGGDRAIIATPI